MDAWPFSLLHTLSFVQNAASFFERQQASHGDIYRCHILGHDHVRVHGADFAQMLYKNKNDIVLSGPAWSPTLESFFPNGLLLKDHKQHITHRRIMQHAFNKPAMLNYFDHIQLWSSEMVTELAGNPEVDFFPYIKEKTLDLALKMFLGIDYKKTFGKEIGQAFVDMVAATLSIVRIPMMNNKFHRGIKGRDTLHKAFAQLTQERREDPQDDLVSYLCSARDEDGSTFTDEQVVDHLIFTMMAAHDTTASSLTSVLYFLTQNPSWQDQLNQEVQQIPSLTYDTMTDLALAENVFKESIRLFPPLVTTPRMFNKDIELNGFQIPAGTRTGINIYSTHRDEQYWNNPNEFDPLRFERKEDKKHPYQFIPFGGGVHKCIGMHLSMMESKLLLAEIFKNFRVQRVDPDAEVEFSAVPIWHPKTEFKLKFNRR
jgi:cytochrome P450